MAKMKNQICGIPILLILVLIKYTISEPVNLQISTHDITVIVDQTTQFSIKIDGNVTQKFNIAFQMQHPEMLQIAPPYIDVTNNDEREYTLCVLGKAPGNSEVLTVITPNDSVTNSSLNDMFLRVTVANSMPLIYVSEVVGWIYFIAWSVSFYPQIYINFKRKSVVGLNFDFLSLNIVGFALYGLFNMGLFWNDYIQTEYHDRFPRGLNPVLINDVVFALHAMAATAVTICQCFIYERAEQRVSTIARSILGIFGVCVVIFAILAGTDVIHWLDFLYFCSYIKLTITLIKYVPQAVMNYRRKSTVGWSIGNIFLDFTGGMLSMLQMMLNAYNYDDWQSIFGDPTKFGLGLFSVLFDIFFMIQHYVLYRNAQPYMQITGETMSSDTTVNEGVTRPLIGERTYTTYVERRPLNRSNAPDESDTPDDADESEENVNSNNIF